MGIANPVTRETHGSGTHYHLQLAKQLGTMLQAPLEVSLILCTVCVKYLRSYAEFNLPFGDIAVPYSCLSLLFQERGGMMALTEVYCLVNRARGMEVTPTFTLVPVRANLTSELCVFLLSAFTASISRRFGQCVQDVRVTEVAVTVCAISCV